MAHEAPPENEFCSPEDDGIPRVYRATDMPDFETRHRPHGRGDFQVPVMRNMLNPRQVASEIHRHDFGIEHGVVSGTMHPNPPPAPAPVATTSHSALRLARSVLWMTFGVCLALLVVLAIAFACLGGGILAGIVAVLAATVLIPGIRRLPGNAWTRLVVGYAVLACVVIYLADDDAAVRRPRTIEAAAPKFPGAEQSYEVFMRYGKAHPLGRDFQFRTSQKFTQGPGAWKPKDPQWTAWLTSNRAELESGWAKLEPLRSWWAELNAFDRIGDVTPPRSDAEIIAFQPVRTLYQHACAIASLQALDGNGDAAIESLLPVLEVSRKLEPSSRTLVRSMLARVAQKMALETAAFVLDTTTVSPAARARFASALTGGIAGEHGARRLVVVEYEWAMVCLNTPDIHVLTFGEDTPGWVRRCLLPLGPIIFNPRRTINLYGELTVELQNMATRRDAGDIDAELRRFLEKQGMRFKNFAGPLLLSWMTPGYRKILENYWATEDLRLALHGRLMS